MILMTKDTVSEEYYTMHMEDNKIHVDSVSIKHFVKFNIHKNVIDSAQWSMVWPPRYWPKNVQKVQYAEILALRNASYISDPTFDGFYSIKSSTSCLFGVIQCVSAIIVSCMRLQNINTMHTMDVLSMISSYFLLCIVISVLCRPAYYCRPVVCMPLEEWKTSHKINDGLSSQKLRLRIYSFFSKKRATALALFFLLTPLCLMAALLIYINKNDTLLLSLSILWILSTTVITPLMFLLAFLLETQIVTFLQVTVSLGLFITLVVHSCLNATPEQKYPSNVNWLPHF
jgi:uncharacterized membrane protein